jgi:endonuclease III related protein
MPTLDDSFSTLCHSLGEHFGRPPDDFDGLAPFEAMIAVLLERELGGSRWRTVLDALDRASLLTPEELARADVFELSDALRDQGVSVTVQSVAPLKHLARWLVDHHGGRVDALFNPDRSTDWLRGELAALGGIGLTTADAIILFALKRPSYPVDRATFRVLVRHDWLDPFATYDEARELLVGQAADWGDLAEIETSGVLADLSRGMVPLGRRYCRASGPLCEGCPLESLLPAGGPRDADG